MLILPRIFSSSVYNSFELRAQKSWLVQQALCIVLCVFAISPDIFASRKNCNFLMENSLFMLFCALFFHMNKLHNAMNVKENVKKEWVRKKFLQLLWRKYFCIWHFSHHPLPPPAFPHTSPLPSHLKSSWRIFFQKFFFEMLQELQKVFFTLQGEKFLVLFELLSRKGRKREEILRKYIYRKILFHIVYWTTTAYSRKTILN